MKGTFHLGDWEVEPQINCVKKGDRSFHLEPKVMQVLVVLAAHTDEVLSKDRLISTVWPDTFVSDDVLTRCISEIRRTLEDDARSPRFIQTIPKAGYRIIAPVTFADEPTNGHAKGVTTVADTAPAPAEAPPPLKRKSSRVPFIIAGLILFAVGFWLLRLRDRATVSYKTVPFTSNLGVETQPAFSPDGNQVAFVWKEEGAKFQHIFVKLIGTETLLKLTSDQADDYSPVYSPDGSSIAFLRSSPTDQGIYIVPAIGGPARKVYTPFGTIEWDYGALSWSPDGRRLIFPDGKSSKDPSSIYALDLNTLEAKRITSPPEFWDGDFNPMFSPDGRKIAFVRSTEGYVRDIHVMHATGGEPQPITFDQRLVASVAWTADSSAIVFSSNRGGKYSLWRIPAKGGTPERLPVGGEDAFTPAIALKGNYLAYAQRSAKWSITKVDLKSDAIPKPSTRLMSSIQQDSAPQFSPDGTHIAFQSWRSGNQEIWTCSSAGTELVMLTSFGGPLTGSPSWSPDGKQIAFDSRSEGHSHIFVVGLNGGAPRSLSRGNFNDIVPSWSRDGKWIYFGSNRSGSWQIWKVGAAASEPQQLTSQGGFVAVESPDANWVYYTKADSAGMWRVPVRGGSEMKVLDQPGVGFWGYWSMAGNQIFYLDSTVTAPAINSFDTGNNRTSRIYPLDHVPPAFSGLTVSQDGKSLLYTDLTEVGSHITLVENFR